MAHVSKDTVTQGALSGAFFISVARHEERILTMANAHQAAFLYQACVSAINNDGDDPSAIMELAEHVITFRKDGYLTDAQVDALADMLGVDVDVPDAPDTYDAIVAGLRADVDDLTDGVAELGEVVSGIIEPDVQ